MRITCDPHKREAILILRGLDLRRAREVFAGTHLTREDDRFDYGETRHVTAGWLDNRIVVMVWTPRGSARRIISMRHCHEHEAQTLEPHLKPKG